MANRTEDNATQCNHSRTRDQSRLNQSVPESIPGALSDGLPHLDASEFSRASLVLPSLALGQTDPSIASPVFQPQLSLVSTGSPTIALPDGQLPHNSHQEVSNPTPQYCPSLFHSSKGKSNFATRALEQQTDSAPSNRSMKAFKIQLHTAQKNAAGKKEATQISNEDENESKPSGSDSESLGYGMAWMNKESKTTMSDENGYMKTIPSRSVSYPTIKRVKRETRTNVELRPSGEGILCTCCCHLENRDDRLSFDIIEPPNEQPDEMLMNKSGEWDYIRMRAAEMEVAIRIEWENGGRD